MKKLLILPALILMTSCSHSAKPDAKAIPKPTPNLGLIRSHNVPINIKQVCKNASTKGNRYICDSGMKICYNLDGAGFKCYTGLKGQRFEYHY